MFLKVIVFLSVVVLISQLYPTTLPNATIGKGLFNNHPIRPAASVQQRGNLVQLSISNLCIVHHRVHCGPTEHLPNCHRIRTLRQHDRSSTLAKVMERMVHTPLPHVPVDTPLQLTSTHSITLTSPQHVALTLRQQVIQQQVIDGHSSLFISFASNINTPVLKIHVLPIERSGLRNTEAAITAQRISATQLRRILGRLPKQ